MAVPKISDNFSVYITFRVSKSQKRSASRRARLNGFKSISHYLRNVIDNGTDQKTQSI
jgi:hypothetical protein